MTGWLMFSVALALIATLLGGAIFAHRKRIAELSAIASSVGWTYTPGKREDVLERVFPFSVFDQGDSRRVWNVMEGGFPAFGADCPAVSADFASTDSDSAGLRPRTEVFTFLCVDLPFLDVPDLRFEPEHAFHKLVDGYTGKDIDVDDPAFDKRVRVTSSDEAFARALLDSNVRALWTERNPRVRVETRSNKLLITNDEGLWNPDTYEAMLLFAHDFLAAWPAAAIDALRPSSAFPRAA